MTTRSYYPPKWNKDRWQFATEEEFATLTDEQFEAFHTGIRADLGEDGVAEFFNKMDRRQAEVRAQLHLRLGCHDSHRILLECWISCVMRMASSGSGALWYSGLLATAVVAWSEMSKRED